MNQHVTLDRTETMLAQLRVKLMIQAHIEDNPQGFTTHHKDLRAVVRNDLQRRPRHADWHPNDIDVIRC